MSEAPVSPRRVEEGDQVPLTPAFPFTTVGVVGLGLMGGSFAKAVKALEGSPRVIGITPDAQEGEAALAAEAVDRLAAGPDGLEGVDLVLYAAPLSAILDLVPGYAAELPNEVIFTDVASLKGPVVEAIEKQDLQDRFVAGHPMTGGEGSGFGASRPTLYRGAPVWLMEETGSPETRHAVETMWRALEARPVPTTVSTHDRRMVWSSHLPQLVANTLARALDGADVTPEDLGPGGRDMTRLASSSPEMWRDLLTHAADEDAAALRVMAAELEAVSQALADGRFQEVIDLMEATRRWRRGGHSE